jgi:hypothetical protein
MYSQLPVTVEKKKKKVCLQWANRHIRKQEINSSWFQRYLYHANTS